MNSYRHEYKYCLDPVQEKLLFLQASGLLEPDPHTDKSGCYLVRSLYFDDYNDNCLWENENGTDPRSKFRIRYYNDDRDMILLEKKSKKRGMTLKESCPLSLPECRELLHGRFPEISPDMPDEKRSLLTQMRLRCLLPRVIVSYLRFPFLYAGGNVRITFDRQITSSRRTDLFLEGTYETRPILPPGRSILEVKWDEVLPLHIRSCMQLETLQWTAFSKYRMSRIYHL